MKRFLIGGVVILILAIIIIIMMPDSEPNVSNNDASNQDIPVPSENGLYDTVTTNFVAERIRNTWTKMHLKSDETISYKNTSNSLMITCHAKSINDAKDSEHSTIKISEIAGYELTDTSYFGLDSTTSVYLKTFKTDPTNFTALNENMTMLSARVQNCEMMMLIQPDGKDDLDAEVKHLQDINEVNHFPDAEIK